MPGDRRRKRTDGAPMRRGKPTRLLISTQPLIICEHSGLFPRTPQRTIRQSERAARQWRRRLVQRG
jgi:hypothetical protein